MDTDRHAEWARFRRTDIVAGLHVGLDRNRRCMAKSAFHVGGSQPLLPVPKRGTYKTCAPSAHSKQIGIEHCISLLDFDDNGHVVDMVVIQQSWCNALVSCVSETAVGLDAPYVIASARRGCAYLAVLNLGRSIMVLHFALL